MEKSGEKKLVILDGKRKKTNIIILLFDERSILNKNNLNNVGSKKKQPFKQNVVIN